MSVVLDRDGARKVLRLMNRSDVESGADNVLDALEVCVRPAPAQTIDRDALMRLLYDFAEVCGTGEDDPTPGAASEILALLRPVDGVTLTREEATQALSWLTTRPVEQFGRADEAVRARLEAAS